MLKDSYLLICLACPLVILRENSLPADILRSHDVKYIYVSSMGIKQYRIEITALEELAGGKVSKNIDWDNCSIQEIWWWATVILFYPVSAKGPNMSETDTSGKVDTNMLLSIGPKDLSVCTNGDLQISQLL